MQEGARNIAEAVQLEIADAGIASTPLMKQLESNPQYSVAQFAQAVGAVYYGNRKD